MLLCMLITCPFFGGLLCYISKFFSIKAPRWIALITAAFTTLIFILILLIGCFFTNSTQSYSNWISEYQISWIRQFGISFHLAVDGLSALMLSISYIFCFFTIFLNWKELENYNELFYLNVLFILVCTSGIFLSIDTCLFFCFWELLSIPIYFLTIYWGNKNFSRENRYSTANKFLIYSQLSGLLMLVSILYLTLKNYSATNIFSFDYNDLKQVHNTFWTECILMLGFFIPFIVKLPIVPFHGWFPQLQEKLPINSSIDLMSLVLKTSIYGLLRFNLSFFPTTSIYFSKYIIVLGLITIFYGAILAFTQTDIKKLISYSSISHSGLALIGIYTFNKITYNGTILFTISNMLSTAMLLVLSGYLYKKYNTRNLKKIKLHEIKEKWLPGTLLFFILANLGIPGTGNFIGEFLILLGMFTFYPIFSITTTMSIIVNSIYSLYLIYNIYFGVLNHNTSRNQVTTNAYFPIIIVAFSIVLIGFFPNCIIHVIERPIKDIFIHLVTLNK